MNFANRIFNITSSSEFNNMAIDIFNYQYQNNTIYQNFCKLLKVTPSEVTQLEKIPFLPIEFLKLNK